MGQKGVIGLFEDQSSTMKINHLIYGSARRWPQAFGRACLQDIAIRESMSEDFSLDGVAGLTEDPNLTVDIRDQPLILTVDRLSTGAMLITDAHFQGAMQEGFRAFTGELPSLEV